MVPGFIAALGSTVFLPFSSSLKSTSALFAGFIEWLFEFHIANLSIK